MSSRNPATGDVRNIHQLNGGTIYKTKSEFIVAANKPKHCAIVYYMINYMELLLRLCKLENESLKKAKNTSKSIKITLLDQKTSFLSF